MVIVSHNDFISLLGCLCSNDYQRYLVTYILHLAIWIDLSAHFVFYIFLHDNY